MKILSKLGLSSIQEMLNSNNYMKGNQRLKKEKNELFVKNT